MSRLSRVALVASLAAAVLGTAGPGAGPSVQTPGSAPSARAQQDGTHTQPQSLGASAVDVVRRRARRRVRVVAIPGLERGEPIWLGRPRDRAGMPWGSWRR